VIESSRSATGSRCFGRVGCNASDVSGGSLDRSGQSTSLLNARSSVSKITRARNQKRPGTSGGGRNQEGKAPNETPSVEPAPALAGESADGPSSKGIRPMNRLRRTPEVDATLLGCWTRGGYARRVYAPEPPLLFSFGRSRVQELPPRCYPW
jgi:hypothetical protein